MKGRKGIHNTGESVVEAVRSQLSESGVLGGHICPDRTIYLPDSDTIYHLYAHHHHATTMTPKFGS